MENTYKILKKSTILIYITQDNIDNSLNQNFKNSFLQTLVASSENEAIELINLHKNKIDIIVSDKDISKYNSTIAFFKLINTKEIILTELLTILSNKIESSIIIKKDSQIKNRLANVLQEERDKYENLVKITENNKYKLSISHHIIDQLLVIFEIDKGGIVTFTNKNFENVFGFDEKYIINKKITNISYSSDLQKALLKVTRFKKPITSNISFKSSTGTIIETLVVLIPHFDTVGYVSSYTLYCNSI